MSAILPSLDLVVNRLTTITVVQSGPQLKTTLAATPTETVVRTSSNVGIHRINTTPVLSNTVAVAYPNSSLLGAQFVVVDKVNTTTSANANSFAVTGATSVLGGGLNYTYGSIVSNVSAYATETYTTPGTYTWTCPEGVTSISMVGIGGGGGGQQRATGGTGGAGGLIDYYNAYTVTPGTSYTIIVGGRGGPGTTAGDNGDATYFVDAAATAPAIYAAGGTGGGNMSWLTGGTTGSIINSTYSSIDTFTAQDSNGGTITYSITNGPMGLVINSSTGVLSYTQQSIPSLSDTYLITINASSTSGSSIDKFYILTFTAESYLYYLLVAGGGGAGADGSVSAASPGTGGGGGVVLGSIGITSTTSGNSLVTIGSGGSVGSNGGNTSAIGTAVFGDNGVVAIGGGAGGSALTGDAGQPGGSGGGGGYSPSVVSGAGGAGLQPSSTWGGYGTGGAAGSQGGLGGSAGGTALSTFAAGSLLFNGSSQWLTVPSAVKFQFGTGDWTIETWFYLNSTSGSVIIDMRGGVTLNVGPMIIVSTVLAYNVANTDRIVGSTTLSTGVWYHVAVVKASGSTKMYLNGVQEGSVYSDSNTYILNGPVIGKFSGASATAYFGGYMTNFRIVKGTAVYTSAFVPTVPLSNVTNTSLLLLVNSDATKIIDSSTSPVTLTNNGSITYSSTIIPSASNTAGTRASGSLVFNGSSYVSYPTNAAWAFGGGNFTVECWFYQTAYPGTNQGGSLVYLWHSGPGRSFAMYASYNGVGGIGASWNTSGGMSGGPATSLNTWYHAAFVRNGASFYLYLNGAQVATTAAVTLVTSSDPLFIGANNDASNPTWFFSGYITNVRIIKGTAVYTSNFAPTVPLAAVSGTSLLLTVANNTDRAVDSSGNNFTPTISGATFSSTVVPSIGATVTTAGGSFYFNGTNATLTSPSSSAFNLAANDFTLEMWVYCITGGYVLNRQTGPSPGRSWGLYIGGGTSSSFNWSNNGTFSSGGTYSITATVTLNAWTHFAFVRKGTVYTFYVNGAAAGSGSMVGTVYDIGSLTIGSETNISGRTYFGGYMTNIRIVNGTAMYNSSFIPTLLSAVTNTTLLLLVSSSGTYLTDSSVNNLTVTSVNTTYNSTVVPTVAGTSGPIAVNILGNVIARYSDGGYAANSSVNYGGGGGRVGYGVAGNAGVAYFWYAGLNRSVSGDLVQSISYGGTNYWLHKFTSTNYLNMSAIGTTLTVDYLLVGGGGGAGYDVGGGGGGGGVVVGTSYSLLTGSTITVTIGQGGTSDQNAASGGADGQLSSLVFVGFGSVTAFGGGGGGSHTGLNNSPTLGHSGGSGGGGGSQYGAAGGSSTQISYPLFNGVGYGYAGGVSFTGQWGGGSGGGAGGPGTTGTGAYIAGGTPLVSTLSGSSTKYAGGGYGNSDSGAIYATGYDSSNTLQGYYGYGANGPGVPNASTYNGNPGIAIIRYLSPTPLASGGVITTSGLYTIHTFTANGTMSIYSTTGTVDVLIVAGGGGGGVSVSYDAGGGGGAGGYIALTSLTLSPNNYTITVGNGGRGARNSGATDSESGQASSAFGYTAAGGGRGGSETGLLAGGTGGSAGGSEGSSAATTAGNTPATTPSQGNAGGGGGTGTGGDQSAGGGGGAGTAGGSRSGQVSGAGGAGSTWLDGNTYAGGGGGGAAGNPTGTAGAGGAGGGAPGASVGTLIASDGTANTGGGGGGAAHNYPTNTNVGGNGGKGVVIVRHPSSYAALTNTGAAVTTTGGYIYYTFTANGTLSIPSSILTPTVEYLVVAGGGGGGQADNTDGGGGGGGAGGFRTAAGFSVSAGTPITVTVGGGGTGRANNSGLAGGNGTESVFGNITAFGGGGGGAFATPGGSAGSGGGAFGRAGNLGGAGTAGQGFLGANSSGGALPGGWGGTGGGGASAASVTNTNANGTAGGAGAASSISGTSVTYAGGGGGGSGTSAGTGGAGGTGGGGAGGRSAVNAVAGTTNTGGGGGGSGVVSDGANGGSGVVIIRYIDAYPAASSTTNLAAGYPVVSGGYRIYKWITSGTITF